MMRQTGGAAVGETSTKSSPLPRATLRASKGGMMPSCLPSSSITRTSLARILSLIRTYRSAIKIPSPRLGREPRLYQSDAPPERLHNQGKMATRMTTSLPFHRASVDKLPHPGDELGEGAEARVAGVAPPHRHAVPMRFAVPDHQHQRDFLQLRVADPSVELFVAIVEVRAKLRGAKFAGHTPRVVQVFLAHRQHHRLNGRQPKRERAGIVLDEDAEKTLDRAQQRAVHHQRCVRAAVRAD